MLLNIGPFPRAGDGYSVNNGGYDPADPYRQTTNASERMIADLSDLDNSLSITPELLKCLRRLCTAEGERPTRLAIVSAVS